MTKEFASEDLQNLQELCNFTAALKSTCACHPW